jgi:SNF2 family DNA or RNA helicase
MLPRQPLRFLLADDPGAGKTIMAGLFIKELIARGDLQRCLVVCPGSLAEQWQDELSRRFHLPFDILTNDKLEAARTGNWFLETNLAIARLDKLSRDENVQEKLKAPECRWDLIVCDEAHKMSATFFGGEVKYTKRYRLGQLLSTLTRHFLLMTATPHNGKEEDFQLFMALIDGDRFEGRFRDGAHATDVSDLMRRMVKEKLLKFDATPLFPDRLATTIPYKLSDAEAALYAAVTEYVTVEFNRAEALQNDKRAGTVGFALTILQRRLASSPEAIYQSLHRRAERLEKRRRELGVLQRGNAVAANGASDLDADDIEDLEDAPDSEVETTEQEVLDQATAARTIAELETEIKTLRRLEDLAAAVRRSGTDTKWRELSNLLTEIFTPTILPGNSAARHSEPPTPKKLVLFTEHRDTLNYLERRISTQLGRKESVVIIHGGMGRELEKNLAEWLKSPISLLFFRHIRCLKLADHTIRWDLRAPGPAPNTEWMTRNDRPDDDVLRIYSQPESFPDEAVEEIRQERTLLLDEECDLTACAVEVVLGTAGRLEPGVPQDAGASGTHPRKRAARRAEQMGAPETIFQ